MITFYPFLLSFLIIFLSELGDKTQVLVLSFSTTSKVKNIFLGIALGTFLSHGIAILFGSYIGQFENSSFTYYSHIFTGISFLLIGIVSFLPPLTYFKKNNSSNTSGILSKLSKHSCLSIFIIAFFIFFGELGDKTFLSSLGLATNYPCHKLQLILGSILGMIFSNCIAIYLGKVIHKYVSPNIVFFLSNLIFILFGVFTLCSTLS